MAAKELSTNAAPGAIGPYSQGIKAGGLLFLSGQIPIEPALGEVVPGGIEAQTHQVLMNLGAVLKEGGATFKNIVKTTVYLKDLKKFSEMNSIYAEYFTAPYPARATVEVSALPKGVEVEIDAIAVVE